MIRATAIRGLDLVALRDWQAEEETGEAFARDSADEGIALTWRQHGFDLSVETLEPDEPRFDVENGLALAIVDAMTLRWANGSFTEWDFFYCDKCSAGDRCSHDKAADQASPF